MNRKENKTEIKDDNLITNFFPSIKKVSNQIESVEKDFYSDCLAQKLNEKICCLMCEDKKVSLKRTLEDEKIKLQNVQKALSSCLYMIKKKDRKIEQLSLQLDEKEQSITDQILFSTPEKNGCDGNRNSKTPKKELFQGYENIFSTNLLATLRSFNSELSTDSTFVLSIIRSLYENDIDTLKGIFFIAM